MEEKKIFVKISDVLIRLANFENSYLSYFLVNFYDQHLYSLTDFVTIMLGHILLIHVEDISHCSCHLVFSAWWVSFHCHWSKLQLVQFIIKRKNSKEKERELPIDYSLLQKHWPHTPLTIWCSNRSQIYRFDGDEGLASGFLLLVSLLDVLLRIDQFAKGSQNLLLTPIHKYEEIMGLS